MFMNFLALENGNTRDRQVQETLAKPSFRSVIQDPSQAVGDRWCRWFGAAAGLRRPTRLATRKDLRVVVIIYVCFLGSTAGATAKALTSISVEVKDHPYICQTRQSKWRSVLNRTRSQPQLQPRPSTPQPTFPTGPKCPIMRI